MGPASYFPSIEKKYGKPIEHWMKELKKVSKLAHMEQVAHLKEKFEMGHGHANALVAYFRKKNGLYPQHGHVTSNVDCSLLILSVSCHSAKHFIYCF